VRELQALVAPKPPWGVLVRGHAGLVINKFSQRAKLCDFSVMGPTSSGYQMCSRFGVLPLAPASLDPIPALHLLLILRLTLQKDPVRVQNQVSGLKAGRRAAAGWAHLVRKVPREMW